MKTSTLTLAQLKARAALHSLQVTGDKRLRSTWENALKSVANKPFTVPAGQGGVYEFKYELIRKSSKRDRRKTILNQQDVESAFLFN